MDKEPKQPLKTIAKMFLVVFLMALGLAISAIVFLSLAHLIEYGINEKTLRRLLAFLGDSFKNPFYIWDSYMKWIEVFVKNIKSNNWSFSLFVPLMVPTLFVFITSIAFIKSSYFFGLWYKFNNRYAEQSDINNMGLFDGSLLALGKFGDKILKLKHCFSVLCLGEAGCGKTSGVAIPSILETDKACIVACDNRNELAKFTSGYRAQLGKVFYFNWNVSDAPLNQEFYPRWNPLSNKNMPNKGNEREQYITGLARYFIANNKEQESDNYWERLATIAMDGILNFFIAKIEQASANDYFLSGLLEKGRLNKEDKEILLSYYVLMSKKYALPAIKNLELSRLDMNNYLPIGSWEGVPRLWQGKEINFAMFTDWLIQSYFAVKAVADQPEIDGWKSLLERWIEEARFFGYNHKALEKLQQLFYLSRKQRSIIFPMLINPLSVFRNTVVRERTSSSDFYMYQSRGIKNPQSGKWEVVTIYNITGNRAVDFIGKLFIDMLIDSNINPAKGYGPFPIVFVIDDVEQQPRYDSLLEGLIHGPHSRMSFLLLSDYVKMLDEKYGKEGLEEIVSNATYKLMLADSYKTLAWKFENLATYGTKSVQIPASDNSGFIKIKSGLTDASYYRIIAKNLNSEKKRKLEMGDEFLIAAGYYHLPIKLQSLYFLQNEMLKEKASISTEYFLAEDPEKKRNIQDMETPTLLEVLQDAGLKLQTEEEIGIFLEDRYEEAVETRLVVADKQSALADDISLRWKSNDKNIAPVSQNSDNEWWMDEDAFSFVGKDEDTNPFKK